MSENFLTLDFEVLISSERNWLEYKSNIEIYSLDKSFCQDILWKLNIDRKNGKTVYRFVEKHEKKENIKFSKNEAIFALKGIFLKADPKLKFNKNPINEERLKFNPYKGKNVAFTLRTKLNEKDALNEFENKNNGNDFPNVEEIKTSPISKRYLVANIHRLLITKETLPLEDCAEILANMFPRKLITWLTYCTDVQKYKTRYGIV